MPLISRGQKIAASLFLLGIIVAVVLLDWLWKAPAGAPKQQVVWVWLANLGLLLLFTIVVGYVITGLLRGVLIDSRNKISLSRLQMILWTVLILSGFLMAVLINIHRGHSEPLSIALDPELWALLGISTTSLVGSPLIKNNKRSEPGNETAKAKTESLMRIQGVDTPLRAEGSILVNDVPDEASWTDIFKGEEVGNGAYLDLGKIQMFFFTVITWFTYAITFADKLQQSVEPGALKFSAFPDLDSGIVALLGISHAAYLTNKAIPHTPTPPVQPQPPPPPPPTPDNPQPLEPNPERVSPARKV